jgi:hypothetical protein
MLAQEKQLCQTRTQKCKHRLSSGDRTGTEMLSLSLWGGMMLLTAPLVLTMQPKPGEPLISSRKLAMVLAIATVYLAVNFYYSLEVQNRGGSPEIIDGQLELVSHGIMLRRLTSQEFNQHRIYEARAPTSLWLGFYLVAFVCWAPRFRRQPVCN